MASVLPSPDAAATEITPTHIYGNEGEIRLRIATGGAGQTGVLRALAERFIDFVITSSPANPNHVPPFKICWLATDTSLSFNALASDSADLAIVYHPYAAQIAIHQGIARPPATELWKDAFNLVGPASNPADLPPPASPSRSSQDVSIYGLFSAIFCATAEDSVNVKFLSRYDKSANNILESRIWTSIGQTPWAEPENLSEWYIRCVAFPAEALREARRIGAYTLVDRGTWLTLREEMRDMVCYKEGEIEWEGNGMDGRWYELTGDGLHNPALALARSNALDIELAERFVRWVVWKEGGQKVLDEFRVGGERLHGTSGQVSEKFVKGATERGHPRL